MNILLVDDEPLALKALKAAVDWEACGIREVYTALSARAARDILSSCSVQLMLVDVEMPEENGIQLLQWVAEHKPEVVYAIVTGHDDFHYIHAALKLESADYLLKPIRMEELLAVIEKMSGRIRGQEEDARIRHYADQWIHQQKEKAADTAGKTYKQEELIDEVEAYLYEHMTDEITIDSVAGHFFISPDYLNRLYKKARGTTINQYLIHIRMELAAELLKEGRLTATAVAGYLGYSSYPSFVNAFKKVHGVSPVGYLEQLDRERE